MSGEDALPNEVLGDDFVRRLSMRSGQLMWLLGAGVSVSAGIPSAWDMIWRFKQELYVAQRKVTRASVADLGDPAVQRLLDSHIASSESLPKLGSPDEYAALFEAAWPAERDRTTFIQGMIAGAKPSYGHVALATLFKANQSHIAWTTNFDHLLEDACMRVYDTTSALSTVALDAPDLAGQLIAAQKWPLEIKLHGDFRSRRLKNTAEELRHQDAALRLQLVDACQRFGMVVAGYSGRDDSIMDSLEEALVHPGAYPGGLFWLHRGDGPPLERVSRLLVRAQEASVDSGLVRINNFDELMRDVVRVLPDVDTSALDALGTERQPVSAAPAPAGRKGWPLIRLNGVEVTMIPANCRKIVCEIGGMKDVREAIERAGVDVIATRTGIGVLGFGSDADFRKALGNHAISEFDLASFETRRLRYDSHERGLLRDALVRALSRAKGLEVRRRRNADLLAPKDPADDRWRALREIVGRADGTIAKYPEISWREGVSVRLEWADEKLWLLLDPAIVFEGTTDETKAVTADFARERTVKRYNRDLDKLISFWASLLAGEDMPILGIGDGIDGRFSVASSTAYTMMAQP